MNKPVSFGPKITPLSATEHFAKVCETVKSGTGVQSHIKTGIQFLDRSMGGLFPGLHMIAGEPGIGKTSLAVQIMANVTNQGIPVLFIGFSEAPERLVLRMLCQHGELDLRESNTAQLDGRALDQTMESTREFLDLAYIYKADATLTADQVTESARDLMGKHKVEKCLIIVDYLQIWAAGTREFTEFRHEIGRLLGAMSHISEKLDCPILAISSQNRSEQGSSSLTSLEGTSDLEYSADSVLILSSIERSTLKKSFQEMDPTMVQSMPVAFNLRKNNFGETGMVILQFAPSTTRWIEETR